MLIYYLRLWLHAIVSRQHVVKKCLKKQPFRIVLGVSSHVIGTLTKRNSYAGVMKRWLSGERGCRKVINKLTQFFCAIVDVDSVIEACAWCFTWQSYVLNGQDQTRVIAVWAEWSEIQPTSCICNPGSRSWREFDEVLFTDVYGLPTLFRDINCKNQKENSYTKL